MRLLAFLIAVTGGFLLNEALLPDVGDPNQILVVVGWGAVLCVAPNAIVDGRTLRKVFPLLLAIGLIAAACLVSMVSGGMPRTPGLPQLGLLAMAATLVVHGAGVARQRPETFRYFAIALVAGGALGSVIGIMQIFAPGLLDNGVAAFLVHPGRAVGNLGQPNHFADTQVWGLLALVALQCSVAPTHERAARAASSALGLLLVLGVVLSGSRAGLLGLGVVAAWGVADRRLPRITRIAMVAALIIAFALHALIGLGGGATLDQRAGSDFSSSRMLIWRNLLTLVAQQPWVGVGWGQLNFAWTLTPLANRYLGFLENAHDLPLQLAVELGLPLAAVVLASLLTALWRALRVAAASSDAFGVDARCAAALVAVMGIHSLLEFPLWYAFFLLPTAWAWGFALGSTRALKGVPPSSPTSAGTVHDAHRAWRIAGVTFLVCGAGAWFDYRTIAELYMPGPAITSLDQRLARAQSSPLFRHYGEYALALQAEHPVEVLPQIQGAARASLDGRLLFAWANALESTGQDDKARYVAARLREFKLPGAAPFFAVCDAPTTSPKPYQCLPASPALTWRDLRP